MVPFFTKLFILFCQIRNLYIKRKALLRYCTNECLAFTTTFLWLTCCRRLGLVQAFDSSVTLEAVVDLSLFERCRADASDDDNDDVVDDDDDDNAEEKEEEDDADDPLLLLLSIPALVEDCHGGLSEAAGFPNE